MELKELTAMTLLYYPEGFFDFSDDVRDGINEVETINYPVENSGYDAVPA